MAKAKPAKKGTRAKPAKAKPTKKAKVKPAKKAKAKPAKKAKPASKARPMKTATTQTPSAASPPPAPPAPPRRRTTTPGMEPFLLTESSPGKFSLLLTTFDAAEPAFAQIGVDGGGYAWDGVAKHVVAKVPVLGDRIEFDPEASMFCAYSDDRAGLEDLGKRLSALYNDLPRLTKVVTVIGPGGFDD